MSSDHRSGVIASIQDAELAYDVLVDVGLVQDLGGRASTSMSRTAGGTSRSEARKSGPVHWPIARPSASSCSACSGTHRPDSYAARSVTASWRTAAQASIVVMCCSRHRAGSGTAAAVL